MAKISAPKCKICRREKEKLFLRGKRCETVRCAVERRAYPPGQHGTKRKRPRLTDYGLHLREKQKLKRMYGVTERQFKRYFHKAQIQTGNTGENMLVLLETRLDNVLYHVGWATSRSQARQFISHGHIMINNKKVTIPSFNVKAGDIITPNKHETSQKLLTTWREFAKKDLIPSWLRRKDDIQQTDVIQLPKREDITIPVNEQLVVEFASR
ncbi:MAG: 30S ribosomal protein S4 [Planctomycetota bacterium]|nr:30S ribosomal protein S4 [Planctomycetota bacterium]MDI6787474.1 30S ribosomal protein S4 [Planctomycetota bacterium]